MQQGGESPAKSNCKLVPVLGSQHSAPPLNFLSVNASSDSELVSEFQTTLLVSAERFFGRDKISRRIRRAFMDTPRHLFAPRFYSSVKRDWIELASSDLRDHLAELYSDHPICIHRDPSGKTLSTISQPSLVLYMLDLLEIDAGQRVFELGGGSGWNAALMGRLVGTEGRVVSLEIIEGLIKPARTALEHLQLSQVTFDSGDASLGASDGSFDRGIFTASAWTLPEAFFKQIKATGLLLFVLKVQPSYDLLCLLRKKSDAQFDSELHFRCSFVPVTGTASQTHPDPKPAASFAASKTKALLDWNDIRILDTSIVDFIEFAKIVFDCQQTYLEKRENEDFDEEFWAIGTENESSLLLFNEDRLILYGDDTNLVRLRRAAKRWQKANQPNIEELSLSVYRPAEAPTPSNDQWLVRRGDATFLWGL